MLILMARKLNGAILIGIVATSLLGMLRGIASWPAAIFSLPHPSSTCLQLDLRGAMHLGLLEIMFVFLFVDLFDNVGTLVGVCEQGGFVKDGKIPRVGRALVSDAMGTIFGALAGTSTVTSYIESVCRHRRRSPYRAQQRFCRGPVSAGGMFCSPLACRDSGLCHRPRSDFGRRADDEVHCARRLDGFQRSDPGFHHHAGHAADVQHCYRPESGADFLTPW